MGNVFDTIRMCIALCVYTSWCFLFCYFGDEVTGRFDSIRITIYECSWWQLPVDLERILGPVIAMAQKPVYLRGAGRFQCTRTIFKKVPGTHAASAKCPIQNLGCQWPVFLPLPST